jgi:hypothetical protein
MIGGDGDVRGTGLDHPEHRRQDASDGGDLPAVVILRGWQCIVMPE